MSNPTGSGGGASAKAVERQMRNWEFARAQRLAQPQGSRPDVEDFICISRVAGAGGQEIATRLGERLGWAVFDKELLRLMADDDATREQLYASMDERDLGWFEEALRSFTDPTFVRNDYFHRLTRTVISLARQGHAVFLGRAVGWILPRHVGLRVRLVAPVETRLRAFAARHQLTEAQAREAMARLEHDRALFVQTHFRVAIEDPLQYDLVLNMDRFSADAAVNLILAARESVSRAVPAKPRRRG